ncbi:hypothetical protein KUL72_27695 [Bradyrhizobium arachidis]|uniref:beta strand repeat-containing protein n=2 Tax=Bradyrhizobium TaxID=374 RepID=UPI002162D336|nr:alkaline phosphatase family protein [Bradyrhizobium arachidis]UVO35209.1 hypothetical protein KUL72_27695 [Bradyrhizobium arachidis]
MSYSSEIETLFSGPSVAGTYPPHNGLAVGPNYIVMVEGSRIEWTDLSGGSPTVQSTYNFFSSLSPTGGLYDQRCVYDPINQRYIVIMEYSASGSTISDIDIAVSKDSNPNDGWYFSQLNTSLTINGQLTSSDRPMLSVDGSNIYITASQFNVGVSGYAGTEAWVIGDTAGAGGGIYNGGTLTVTASELTPTSQGIFGVSAGGNGKTYYASTYPSGSQLILALQAYDVASNSFGSISTINLGAIDQGGSSYTAQQLGTSLLLDAGDKRIASMVYANGFLYAVGEVEPTGSTVPVVHWLKVDVSNPDAPTLVAQGNISGDAIGINVATFNPSLAVDAAGDVLINFTASGPNMYPADYYVFQGAQDPVGSFSAPILYQASTGFFNSGASGVQRWGVNSTAVVDPNNPNSFWISNEYIANGWWQTSVAQIAIQNLSAVTVSSITPSGTGITNGAGDLNAGDVVTLTINFSAAVTADTSGGTPTLTLNDGGIATYAGGSGSTALTFSYTVAAGQNTSDLTVSSFNLNGAAVTDGAGNAADVSGAANNNPSGILQIDTSAPVPAFSQYPASSTNSTTAIFAVTTSNTETGGVSYAYELDGANIWTPVSGNNLTLFGLALGSHAIQVQATDGAGNVSTSPTSYGWTITPPAAQVETQFSGPSVTGTSPPNNALAVGPNNVVMMEASRIEWTNLTGGSPTLQSVYSFFSPLGAAATNSLNHPRCVYDSVNQRYVVIMDNSASGHTVSNIDIAVSKDSNPNDGWYFASLNTSITINGQLTSADSPTLTVDGTNVYITATAYNVNVSGTAGTECWVISDTAGAGGGLYNGGTLTVVGSEVLPATQNVFTAVAGNNGKTYYASDYSNGSQIVVTLQAYDTATNTFGTSSTISLGNIDQGGSYTAQQLGTSLLLDAGDKRARSLVYSNGFLYGVAEVKPVGSNVPEVHWYKIDVSNPNAPFLVAQGDISGATIGTNVATFNPSIAVDAAGDAIINFTASGPNMYPADYYAYQRASDPPGSFSAPILYQASTGFFNSGNGSSVQPWGNYSTATVDPNNANSFWISNEYVAGGWWQTSVAQVAIQSPTAAPTVSSIATSGTGIAGGTGNLNTGQTATLTVNLSAAVTVDTTAGAPTLTLNDGGIATYVGGSGSTALTFGYTVAAGQNTPDLAVSAFNLNGAVVSDSTGNAADLSKATNYNPAGTLEVNTSGVPHYGHIVVVVEENKNYGEIAGNIAQAPYINSLMAGGASFTNFTAETHPSEPNYYALYAGSTFGITDDGAHNLADPTLYTLLQNAGLTFTGYVDDSGTGNTSSHEPWVSFPEGRSVQTDFTSFPGLFPTGDYSNLPNISFVIPNPTDDMHDGTVAQGDAWLQQNLSAYAQWALANNSLLVVTWDESDTSPTNQIPTVMYGADVASGSYGAAYNHYNLLSTILASYGLTGPNNAATAAPIQVFGSIPAVSSITTSGPAITGGSGDLNAGQVVTLTVTFNEPVTINTSGGTPTLILNEGGAATYTGGTGSTALTFSYTVAAGQNSADLAVSSFSLNGATATDGAGNDADLSGATNFNPTGILQIDTVAPTISSIAASGPGITNGNGDLDAGRAVTLTVNFNEPVTVNTASGSPTLALNDGGIATYTGGTGSTALTFSYTVAAGQNTPDLTVTSLDLNGATMTDGAGNAADLSGATNFNPAGTLQIDTLAPSISSIAFSGPGITNGNGNLGAGKVVTLTVNFSAAVTVDTTAGSPTLILNDGGTATYTGGTGSTALTFSYTVAAGQNTPDLTVSSLSPNGATMTDGAGNAADLSGATNYNPGGTLQIDTLAPTVSSITTSGTGITNGAGDLNAGQVVTLTVSFSAVVTVNSAGGSPTLTLNDGGTATYTGGTGSTALTFSYTVAAGQNTSDLTVSSLNLSGAIITDGAGNAADLSGASNYNPAGTLQIDTLAPIVSSITTSGTGITNGAGDLNAGDVVTLTVNFSEAVAVNTAGGSPTLILNDGGNATYTGGTGSTALTFTYTVTAGQNTPDLTVSSLNPNGATITDGAGNAANLSGATNANPSGALQIDTIAPTISSIAVSGTGITNGTGILKAGQVVTFTVNCSEAVTVNTAGGTPSLGLNDGGTATYTGGSGSAALTFSYTVAAGQNTPDLTVSSLNLNGATMTDGAGNLADLSGAANYNPAGTLQIDTTAPSVPTGLSLDAATDSGALGDGITNLAQIKIDGTAAPGSTITLYDSNGTTVIGTGTANATTGAFGITTSVLANGTHNITAKATDAAGNVSPASSPCAVTVDTTAPTVTSIATSGAGIAGGSGDLNAGKVVTLTLNFSQAVTVNTSGGSPTLTLNDGGSATYAGGSGTSALVFSYTVAAGQNTSDLIVSRFNLNGATVRDLAANNANLAGATNYNPAGTLQIDTSAPTISINTIAGNNIVSGTEASAGFAITGKTTAVENGQIVTVNILNSANTIVDSYTTADSSNAWSVTVTSAQALALADGQYTVAASVLDKAGNPAPTGTRSLTVDEDKGPEAPTLSISNTSPTVPAGGSIPLGITATPVDADDRLSVTISGVPSYEVITAPSGYSVSSKKQSNGTYTWTITQGTAGTPLTGLTLTSHYTGTGHPVATFTVTASNTTSGEAATSAAQTMLVTDPPVGTSGGLLASWPQGLSVASAQDSGNVDRLLALMDQFTAAGFESNRPGTGTITPTLDPNGGRDHPSLAIPNQPQSWMHS